MTALFNELDSFACEWLRNLSIEGHIAPGRVLEDDIRNVRARDLDGFEQAHFFAGIGVWSRALRLAGWPDDQPVWTGSCPCQPFSQAGRGKGFDDERHLWPTWFKLIAECRPLVVLGEQVASKDGLAWLDLVSSDLEKTGYTFAAFNIPAACVGAPHIRQRLYFVAVSPEQGRVARRRPGEEDPGDEAAQPGRRGAPRDVAHADGAGRGLVGRSRLPEDGNTSCGYNIDGCGTARELGDARSAGGRRDGRAVPGAQGEGEAERVTARRLTDVVVAADAAPGPVNGFWSPCDWLLCSDGRSRAAEPGTFPLAHGVAGRVGRLRAYGNAVVAPLAQVFIMSVMDYLDTIGVCDQDAHE